VEREEIKTNKGSQRNGQAVMTSNWSYTKETSPSFSGLMIRLLQPRRNQMEMDNEHKDDATE